MTEMLEKLPSLPLGTASFAALRAAGAIYVDKTDRVAQLAEFRRKLVIVRPWGFGKSLLLSTFKSLFEDGLRDFTGLRIALTWHDKTYPVVHLDFSKFKEFRSEAEFRRAIKEYVAERYGAVGFRYDPDAFFDIYEQLQIWLESQPPSFYVLLIDEYDAPWVEHLDDPEVFQKIRRILASFYATVKTTEGSLRFLFMTGVTKFRQTGVFSALNITEDWSLSANVATLLGFTAAEIRASFGGYLARAARVLSSATKRWTVDDVLVEMRRHYGGYCFDGTLQEHVCNLWSVMKFLDAPEAGFAHYGIPSGGLTTGLGKYVQTHERANFDDFQVERCLPKAVWEGLTTDKEISDTVLLTQLGYLTLKRREAGDFYVGCPNEEAASAMAALSGDRALAAKCRALPAGRDVGTNIAIGS